MLFRLFAGDYFSKQKGFFFFFGFEQNSTSINLKYYGFLCLKWNLLMRYESGSHIFTSIDYGNVSKLFLLYYSYILLFVVTEGILKKKACH